MHTAAGHDSQRLPSPALTEIEFPESQDIVEEVLQKGIKIRDFAYEAPYVLPTAPIASPSTSDAPSGAITGATPLIVTSGVPPPKRTTEIFDPYKALTEIDYRWTQKIRRYPVTGKTLRRLLDVEWLTPAELSSRAHPMDGAALRKYDEQRAYWREANEGIEAFPWRSLRADRPTEDERQVMLDNYRGHWKQQDRMMMKHEDGEEMRRMEEEMAREKMKEMQERELQREKKRSPGVMEEVMSSSFKKRKLSSPGGVAPSESLSSGHLIPPKKQYPAALQAYDPKVYPDAANIIEASSQNRPPPLVYHPPPTSPGRNTPPSVGRTDTPPIDEGDRAEGRRGQRLERKNAKLGRTQTFVGL
jgi:hypothetical protein